MRTYTLGVPLLVEVADDGTVTCEVDLSEVDLEADDAYTGDDPGDEQRAADATAAAGIVAFHRFTPEHRNPDALGPCGCTDYHMSDCPLRTAGRDSLDPPDPDAFYERDDRDDFL